MTDKQKILQFLEIKGISKNKFYQTVGLSTGFLDSGSSLGVDKLRKIIDNYHDFNVDWFLTGKGDIIKSPHHFVAEPAEVYKLKSDRIEEEQSIPLYNVQASAGVVTLFSDSSQQKAVDYITVPNLPKCDGAVYVTGDSMYPLLKNGDIVMYKQIKDFEFGILYGEIYIVNMELDGDDYISVKWLHKSEKGEDWIKLVSENRYHPDKDIPLKKVRALALVKASIRINSMS